MRALISWFKNWSDLQALRRTGAPYLALAMFLLAGCATIGPEHEQLSREVSKGIDQQERQYLNLVDEFERNGRERIDERMRFIEGPVVMKYAVKASNFRENICEAKGDMDQAFELLEFTMAASRSFEERKAKYVRALEQMVSDLRTRARDQFTLMRQAADALTNGLKAYNRDKAWRQEMLKSMGAPVDQAAALNDAAKKFDSLMREEPKK